jgi:class 3 adenylate cyclase
MKSDKEIEVPINQEKLPEKLKKSINSLAGDVNELTQHLPVPSPNIYTKFSLFVSSMSIRYKIAGALIIVLMFAIASLGMVTFSHQKRILEDEIKKRAEVLVHQLANVGKEGLLTKEDLPVYSTIKDLQKHVGVAYAMVIDAKGAVFVHNILTEKDKILENTIDRNALKTEQLLIQQTTFNKEPIMDAALPIFVLHKDKTIRIGTARIGLSEKELLDAISAQKFSFFWISVVFVIIGLLIAFALAKILTTPIYTLVVGMQIVAQGDLNQQVKVSNKDEIGKLTESFNQMILSLREKLHMEKYLSHSVLDSIHKVRDTSQLRLGGERKFVTALFSDVRGFTSMSEKMTPEEVVEVLNVYLNLQAKIVHIWGGIVDKFVGDEIMAIFEGKGQEVNAVRAAIEIQMFCKTLNHARAILGKKQMNLGIGLNSGDVVMGNMGSQEQMNYTVIGDNINIASRLCSAAGAGQVVISKAVADVIGKEARLGMLEPVLVKGKDKPINIFEASDIKGVSRKTMRRAINTEISFCIEGLADETNTAVVKNVGAGGCILEVSVPLGMGSKLELQMNEKLLKQLHEAKATVRHVRKIDNHYYAGVSFEGLSDLTQASITDWVHQVQSDIVSTG